MKSFLSFFLCLLIATQSLAVDDGLIKKLGLFGSVQNTAKYLCIEGSEDTTFFKENYKNICEIVKRSDECQKLEESDQLKCDDSDENSIDVASFSFIYNCARGLWKSLKDLFYFIVNGIKGTLGYAFNADKRDEINTAMGEYFDSFANYLAVEFDKERDKTNSDFKAISKVAGNLLKTLFTKLGEKINATYHELGCYHQKARQERVCKIVGDVVLPPAAALAIIFKGPKLIKGIVNFVAKKIEKKKINKKKLKLVDQNAPILTKKAREITKEEVQGQNIKRLAEKMVLTLEDGDLKSLAAPQIGQGVRLIALKAHDGGTKVLANPKINGDLKKDSTNDGTCLSLNGVLCDKNKTPEIEVNYLDLNGKSTTESFKGQEAALIHHATDYLDGTPLKHNIKNLEKIYGLKDIQKLPEVSQEKIRSWLTQLSPEEAKRLKTISEKFSKSIHSVDDPNSLLFSIKSEKGLSHEGAMNELLNYYDIIIKDGASAKKFKLYNSWVKSDAHALFLYDELSASGLLDKHRDLLRYLLTYNPHFTKTHGTKKSSHSLVTYSFEKESKKDEITMWFKRPEYSDEDWLKIPDETRLELIKKATLVKKYRMNEARITSTELKPHYVGNYSQEMGKDYNWEIANKKYEINLDRLMGEVKEISQALKETHSFHTHIVFDMPKNYPDFDKFQIWSKQVNDYLYAKGMEEGLHGNELTGLAYLPEDVPPSMLMSKKKLPESLSSVKVRSHKYFSMGIRGDLYGDSPIRGHKKLGLELRDTTRKLDVLEDHMKKITDGVTDYRWEKWDEKLLPGEISFIRPKKELFKKELQGIISQKLLKDLENGDVNSSIPLQHFEEGTYFDFKGNKTFSLSQEQKERLIKARAYYIEEIKKIDLNVQELTEKGVPVVPDEIDLAMKMTLSEWAQMAKLSEFFSGF